uniref:Uncharacterized protein n=1 Tax=Megaviridae environmental sample TaxID=1737588 RepID=A0A5J6VHW6_9VIRU|nr:MAG: hypothetical protein [Megaviridae environmental sample]
MQVDQFIHSIQTYINTKGWYRDINEGFSLIQEGLEILNTISDIQATDRNAFIMSMNYVVYSIIWSRYTYDKNINIIYNIFKQYLEDILKYYEMNALNYTPESALIEIQNRVSYINVIFMHLDTTRRGNTREYVKATTHRYLNMIINKITFIHIQNNKNNYNMCCQELQHLPPNHLLKNGGYGYRKAMENFAIHQY